MKKKGMGSHESARMLNDEWLTPPEIINQLGPFDLDPCAPVVRPWNTASRHFTVKDNGLLQQWEGFVWCNPPYGKETSLWLDKMAIHNNGIALIFARTETKMFFQYIWPLAESVFFIEGRLRFYNVDGMPGKHTGGGTFCINCLWRRGSFETYSLCYKRKTCKTLILLQNDKA